MIPKTLTYYAHADLLKFFRAQLGITQIEWHIQSKKYHGQWLRLAEEMGLDLVPGKYEECSVKDFILIIEELDDPRLEFLVKPLEALKKVIGKDTFVIAV